MLDRRGMTFIVNKRTELSIGIILLNFSASVYMSRERRLILRITNGTFFIDLQ